MYVCMYIVMHIIHIYYIYIYHNIYYTYHTYLKSKIAVFLKYIFRGKISESNLLIFFLSFEIT